MKNTTEIVIMKGVNMNLNLKNDIIFKAFFSRKGNEKYLKEFLEALLKIEIERIIIKEEVSLEKLFKIEKGGRLDLLAKLNDGISVNIEMQVNKQSNYLQRTSMYASKLMSREVGNGLDFKEINQTILINILNFELFNTEEYISETVTVLDKHREYEVIKNPKWYFIELPKFRRIKPDINDTLNQWLLFIDDYDRGLIKMAEDKNETLKEARSVMTYLTGDEEVKRLAELREIWAIDRAFDRKEAKREVAEEMLKNNISIEIIANCTGLTKEEIEKLKE